MRPFGVALVALRKLVIELDIAGQADAHVGAFDQVVAQHPLFREPARQHATEGAHVIDPLAVVRAFTAEVLMDIGDSLGVGVDSNRVGEQPTEGRCARARQGWAHARLDDGVGAGRNSPIVIEARRFRGWARVSIILRAGPVRQLGVAVQGDDEPYVRKVFRVADIYQPRGGFRPCSHDQVIEFFQLAPLAFPTDEFLLGITPGAFAMEQEETPAPVALIEIFDTLDCRPEQQGIVIMPYLMRIGVVREQAEEQIVFLVGQVANFQLLHLGAGSSRRPPSSWARPPACEIRPECPNP